MEGSLVNGVKPASYITRVDNQSTHAIKSRGNFQGRSVCAINKPEIANSLAATATSNITKGKARLPAKLRQTVQRQGSNPSSTSTVEDKGAADNKESPPFLLYPTHLCNLRLNHNQMPALIKSLNDLKQIYSIKSSEPELQGEIVRFISVIRNNYSKLLANENDRDERVAAGKEAGKEEKVQIKKYKKSNLQIWLTPHDYQLLAKLHYTFIKYPTYIQVRDYGKSESFEAYKYYKLLELDKPFQFGLPDDWPERFKNNFLRYFPGPLEEYLKKSLDNCEKIPKEKSEEKKVPEIIKQIKSCFPRTKYRTLETQITPEIHDRESYEMAI